MVRCYWLLLSSKKHKSETFTKTIRMDETIFLLSYGNKIIISQLINQSRARKKKDGARGKGRGGRWVVCLPPFIPSTFLPLLEFG